ncbi:MAG: HAD hydrolase-like protein [Thiobacillaceae bacterium]|nr:HAD hydrolase-like protein [Thiobacillaceae bacterium]
MYPTRARLVILDADGTTIDAFEAIERTFARHGMAIGDLERFQKRRHLFKYLGGLKEFPANLRRQLGKQRRRQLLNTLTEVYRAEARLFPGIPELIATLVAAADVRVGLVTRNITYEPAETLRQLFARHGVDVGALDFLVTVPLGETKTAYFRALRAHFGINPARAFVCGDEHRDYLAAVASGMHPFIVSYGFEDHERLTRKFEVPEEVIARTPAELAARLCHALDLVHAEQPRGEQPVASLPATTP